MKMEVGGNNPRITRIARNVMPRENTRNTKKDAKISAFFAAFCGEFSLVFRFCSFRGSMLISPERRRRARRTQSRCGGTHGLCAGAHGLRAGAHGLQVGTQGVCGPEHALCLRQHALCRGYTVV